MRLIVEPMIPVLFKPCVCLCPKLRTFFIVGFCPKLLNFPR